MRDTLEHRGPDGAGLWSNDRAALAHRRLAVLDPTPAGHQPWVREGESVLVYNGEVYNDQQLRTQLDGVEFRTGCDTETVAASLAMWGVEALSKFRGMYALGFVDLRTNRLVLARDPLGIKPLYYTRTAAGEIVFASELPAILAHPGVRASADWRTVSGYLTTIRTTLDDRSMFEGIRLVRPGEWITFDLSDPGLGEQRGRVELAAEAGTTRAIVDASVRAHLRSDVPVCCLLSGGLDSSICAFNARDAITDLRTFCAGASDAEPVMGIPQSEDFGFARQVAGVLGTDHREAHVSEEGFGERWPWLVSKLGVPLSTPNEVAIYEVARAIRASGCVVALSGEGADELFGGYEAPLRHAAMLLEQGHRGEVVALAAGSWVPLDQKPGLCAPELLERSDGDHVLIDWVCRSYAESLETLGDPLSAMLGVQRRMNLAGLLQRLDTSTMLASIEGRTPLADTVVAAHAEGLPRREKFDVSGEAARTKWALRQAYRDVLPAEVVERPKASFPLPFQRWVGAQADLIRGSAFLREVLTEPTIQAVADQPQELWSLAWPAANLAMWSERWL